VAVNIEVGLSIKSTGFEKMGRVDKG
jgi:hypothetical protein